MTRFFRKTALAAVLCLSISGTAFAANLGAGVVQASALHLRAEASTESQSLAVVPYASGVIVTGETGDGWYSVIYRGQSGYMSGEYLSLNANLNGNFGVGAIQGTTVRLRAEPNTSSQILGTYDTGTQMNITGVAESSWYKVSYNGGSGWVSSRYCTLH